MDFFLSCFRDRDAEHSRGDMRRLWLSYPWQIFVQNKWQCLARKLSAVRHLSAVTVRNLLQQERSPLLQIGLRQVSTFQFRTQNVTNLFCNWLIQYTESFSFFFHPFSLISYQIYSRLSAVHINDKLGWCTSV